MDMLNETNPPTIGGLTWKQLSLLVVIGVVIGLVLALTLSLPVS